MTTSLVKQKELNLKTAKRKGWLATGVAGVGVATGVALSPFLGVPIVAYGGWLGWKWFKFRVDNKLLF